jgi:hypothetical protein
MPNKKRGVIWLNSTDRNCIKSISDLIPLEIVTNAQKMVLSYSMEKISKRNTIENWLKK